MQDEAVEVDVITGRDDTWKVVGMLCGIGGGSGAEVRGVREGFLKAGFESIKVDPAEWAGAVDAIVSRRISKADKDGYGFLVFLVS